MATDLNGGVEVAFDGKSDLNLTSFEVGGDCNGIVHHSDEGINDADGSYVFVDDADTHTVSDDPVQRDPESVVDRIESLEGESVSEEKMVEIEELRVEEEKSNEAFSEEETVDDNAKDEEEKNDTAVDLNDIETDIMVKENIVEPDNEEKVEEDNKLLEDSELEEQQESTCMDAEAVESDSNQSTHGEDSEVEEQQESTCMAAKVVKSESNQSTHEEEEVEEKTKLDSGAESTETQESSQTELTDATEPKLHQPDYGEDNVLETSTPAESKEENNQNFQPTVVEVAESDESHQVNNEEEKVEEQSNLVSFTEVEVYQESEIAATPAVETNQTGDGEECKIGDLADGIPAEEVSSHLETDQVNLEMTVSPSDNMQVEIDAANGTDESGESLTTCPVEQTVSETKVINSAEGQESISTCPVGEIESESTEVNGSVENTKCLASAHELKSETDIGDVSVENGEGLPAGAVAVACAGLEEVGNGSIEGDHNVPAIPVDEVETESEVTNGCTGSINALPADPVGDLQLESGVGDSSSVSKEELSCAVIVTVNGESMPNCIDDIVNVEKEVDQSISGDSNGKSISEGEVIEGNDSNGSLSLSPEDSTTDTLDATKVDCEVGRRPFRFLIRIPRYVDDKIRNQIELAQRQVDEKTQTRDAIRSKIQAKRATCSGYRDKFDAARSEERAARDALNAKRREMDSVQSVINRMKNATSIEDIDNRVHNMEHRIEHETMPLKEEKQLIRDIKQMKNLREQLCVSLGQHAEVQPTSDERERIEDRYKLLKQEMESSRTEVVRVEGIAKTAWKIYSDENEKLKDLHAQFRAADDLRQEAYIQLQNLKKQLYEKNKCFRMYKEEAKNAEGYSLAGDKEAVQRLCVNQVEKIMELWNKNDEFRNEYIRCNTQSTLRRLRTLDGRSLGPEEESPVLHNVADRRAENSPVASPSRINSSLLSTLDQGKSVIQDVGSVVNLEQKNLKADMKSVVNLEQNYPTAKSKKTIKPAALENGAVTVFGREEIEDKEEEKTKRTKEEEEELARREEELRKEAAAKLKEQRRLEEKAKAKEAEERKRRNAEKAQVRAELRAQKEADLKEKEREKKAKKKERKKMEATSGGIDRESASSSEIVPPETTEEPEIKEKPKTVTKRPQKASVSVKQTKPKVVPPPLRSRGKRRMQQWMWILLAVVVVVALFLVGNSGYSLKFGLPSFRF